MININIPDSAFSTTSVSLNGRLYELEFSFNDTTNSWYMGIYLQKVLIGASIKLLQNVPLLKFVKPSQLSGDLIVVMMQQTENTIGRDNLGVGKEYSLLYIPPES